MTPRFLIIDDERNFREFLGEALEAEGYDVELAASAATGLAAATRNPPQVVLLDQNLPDRSGLDLLADLRQLPSNPVIVVITAYPEPVRAVSAIKSGALHYLGKPFDFPELLGVLGDACVISPARGAELEPLSAMVGECSSIARLKQRLVGVARSPLETVLLHGESGTGKEVVARSIHALSTRASRQMIAVNCAALSDSLLLSELFGHERGAFTDARERRKGVFEAAHHSTLFLDEISEMGPSAQAALLRVLEQRVFTRLGSTEEIAVDVRVIAATNRDLGRLVRDGTFREDLYYRLNVVQLDIPPLRDRGADVLLLARFFARTLAARYGGPARTLTPAAEAAIRAYGWPGNVRELRNAIEHALVVGVGAQIEAGDLPTRVLRPDHFAAPAPPRDCADLPFREAKKQTIEVFERTYLSTLLTQAGGNVTHAAQQAGLHRQAFQRLLGRHSLDRGDFN